MNREQKVVCTLITLLTEWVIVQARRENHYNKIFDKRFANLKAETEEHKRLLDLEKPFLAAIRANKFHFSQIMGIIPAYAKTSCEERALMLEELTEWALWHYNLGDWEVPLWKDFVNG